MPKAQLFLWVLESCMQASVLHQVLFPEPLPSPQGIFHLPTRETENAEKSHLLTGSKVYGWWVVDLPFLLGLPYY